MTALTSAQVTGGLVLPVLPLPVLGTDVIVIIRPGNAPPLLQTTIASLQSAVIPNTVQVVTTVNLTAGQFVSFGPTGLVVADPAVAPADGFVLAGYLVNSTATVYLVGSVNTALLGLIPGDEYFLAAAGGVSLSQPGSGYSQVLGKAAGVALLPFNPQPAITL